MGLEWHHVGERACSFVVTRVICEANTEAHVVETQGSWAIHSSRDQAEVWGQGMVLFTERIWDVNKASKGRNWGEEEENFHREGHGGGISMEEGE